MKAHPLTNQMVHDTLSYLLAGGYAKFCKDGLGPYTCHALGYALHELYPELLREDCEGKARGKLMGHYVRFVMAQDVEAHWWASPTPYYQERLQMLRAFYAEVKSWPK